MKILKKIGLLTLLFTVTGCTSKTVQTDDQKEVYTSNKFLTDKYSVLKSRSLSKFLTLIEDQQKGFTIDADDEDKKIDLNDAERKTVAIIGSLGSDRADMMAYILNDLAKTSEFKDKIVEYVYVDISSARTNYKEYVNAEAGDKDQANVELGSETGMKYAALMKLFGLTENTDYTYEKQWPMGELCRNIDSAQFKYTYDETDKVWRDNDIDPDTNKGKAVAKADVRPDTGCAEKTVAEIAAGAKVNANMIEDVLVVAFDKGVAKTTNTYLFNAAVIDVPSQLYTTEDSGRKTLNEASKCVFNGEDFTSNDNNYVCSTQSKANAARTNLDLILKGIK